MDRKVDQCSSEGCAKSVRRRGLCRRHYQQALNDGSIPRARQVNAGTVCKAEDCERGAITRGYCAMHYARLQRRGVEGLNQGRGYKNFYPDGTRKDCAVQGCDKGSYAHGLCKTHESQRRRGIPLEGLYIPGRDYSCEIPNCGRATGRKSRLCEKHNRTRWLYSLDIDRFVEMYSGDDYKCGNPGCGSTQDLHIDHDHSCCGYSDFTTKLSCGECVRGWLCQGCNLALGHLRESPERLLGLLTYLNANAETPSE